MQTEIWSTTLTVEVGTFAPTTVGYNSFHGALSDTDFVQDGTTYEVLSLFEFPQHSFHLVLTSGLADTCGLVLELDNLELKFRDAETYEGSSEYDYSWAPSSLGWTDNQSVAVKLVASDGSPCAPTGLTATAQDGRVALTWTAGGGGDSAITKHQVCRKEGSASQLVCAATDWTDIPDSMPPNGANAASFTVRELENGTEYAFRVRAVNDDGGGIASNDATATPMATAPDAPTGLEATPGDGSVTLRWTAPDHDGGSEITGYRYRQKITGAFGDDWQNIPMSASGETNEGSFTVSSGLTNDTTYTFQVQAVNAEGGSGPSNEARATPVAGDTTAPVLQSATTTALSLELFYDEDLDGGSEPAPSAFTVTVDGASRAVTAVSVDDDDNTKVTLTLASAVRAGETVRVSYTVPMTGRLQDEASNPAASFADHPVTNLTPATAPDAPTGLEATPGDESVTLRWTAPDHDGGSEITGYRYRQKTTGAFGDDWQNIPMSASGETNEGSFTVSSGLTNDTTYTFQVQAVNAEGGSGPSNEARATPVAGDTTAPMLTGATTTAFSLELFYDEDLDAGSEPAPSAFTVTVNDVTLGLIGVALDETKVVLTLALAVRAGDLVRVSYTVPAMNPLQDEAMNPAASFSDHPVTNAVPTTAPGAPSDLTAIPGDESVTLRWTAPTHDGSNEAAYYLYRQKTTGGFGGWLDILGSDGSTTEYTVTGLTNGTPYTFEVLAENSAGQSDESNEATATPMQSS